MPITTLQIHNVRNLAAIELQPSPRLNVICGNNGSGKTSLLEAIYYLSTGKSFRSSVSNCLIKQSTEKMRVLAELLSHQQRSISMGVERALTGAVRSRVNGSDVNGFAELAQFLPVRIVNSQSHQLFEAGPAYRRKFLDWGLFYQAEGFLSCWRHFEHVLKQRNTILRDKKTKSEWDVWTNEFVRHAKSLHRYRHEYVNALTPLVIDLAQNLLPITRLTIDYDPGWNEEEDLATLLSRAYMQEMRFGYTLLGPHRADLNITIEGVPVKHYLSRGQQKLLTCAMIVAQGILLAAKENGGLIYLIDDLPAELDINSRRQLLTLLCRQNTQLFITAIEQETVFSVIENELAIPMKVFHVEHGHLKENVSLT